MFDSLGLTERSLAVYRAVLQHPRLMNEPGLGELSTQLGLAPVDVQTEIDRLRDLGLVVPRWTIADEEYPLHPSVAFERLTARRQQQLDELTASLKNDQIAAGQFIADYSEFLVQRTARDIEVL